MPYINEQHGKLTGLDGDIFNAIARQLHLKVVPVLTDFPSQLSNVQTRRVDIGIGDIAWRDVRAKAGLFTDPPYYSPTILAEAPGLHLTTIEQLSGHTLGTVSDFVYIPALKAIPHAKVRIYPIIQDVFADLSDGRLDVGVVDPLTVVYTHLKRPDLNFHPVTLTPPTASQVARQPAYGLLDPFMSGYYLPFQERHFEVVLNQIIRDMYKSGVLSQIVRKWGGDPQVMLKPPRQMIGAFTRERRAVDRGSSWQPPSI
jgi:ABC-type amino acid transport substrate-binding protein